MENTNGIRNVDDGLAVSALAAPVNVLQPTRSGHFREMYSENSGSDSQAHASTFKKILVPMTFSGSSAGSLALACDLARKSGAQLVLVHAVHLNIAGEERGIHRSRLLAELHRAAELELMQWAASISCSVTTEIIVCEGCPAEAIVQTAGRVGADAIVMSARPHPRWLKWLYRNTTLHVVRQAPCAVILVSAEQRCEQKLATVQPSSIGEMLAGIANHKSRNPFRSLLRILSS